MTLGGYDLEKFATGPINWHKIDQSSNWWVVQGDTIGYGDFKGVSLNGTAVVVDTGTSYISIPHHIFNMLNENLDWMDCDTAGVNGLAVMYCQTP